MELKEATRVWAQVNARQVSEEKFLELYGVSFDEYGKANKKQCLAEWRKLNKANAQLARTAARIKREQKTKKGCICEAEERLPWNADNNGLRRRLWVCPVHGNTFCFKEQVEFPKETN